MAKGSANSLNKSLTWTVGAAEAVSLSSTSFGPTQSADSSEADSISDLPPSASQERVSLGTVVCLYTYTARNDSELNVDENDHLILLEKANEDWWYCRNENGEKGFLPTTYIREEFEGDDPHAHSHDPAAEYGNADGGFYEGDDGGQYDYADGSAEYTGQGDEYAEEGYYEEGEACDDQYASPSGDTTANDPEAYPSGC
jgi:hypothetical protein